MNISIQVKIAAPPEVVFRFYTQLDHLRFISPRFRFEWCTQRGAIVLLGAESEVRIQQHRHAITVRFKTTRMETDRFLEDEFVSWPVKGARHTVTLREKDGGTVVEDVITWDPPWFLRRVLDRYIDEQRRFFEERQAKAKTMIEAVYVLRGAESFREGIFPEAELAGIEAVVPAAY